MPGAVFERGALNAALSTVGRVRPWQRGPKSPALIRLQADGTTAVLTSTNFEMQLEVRCACEGEPVAALVPLDALTAFIGKTPDGSIIHLSAIDGGALATVGRGRARLLGAPIDATAARPALEAERAVLPAAALAAGLRAAVPATDDNPAQPYLGGVHIAGGDDGLAFIAQDGNRLHVAAQDGNRLHVAATIPWRLVDVLLAVLPTEGDAAITATAAAIQVEAGAVRWSGQLLEGTYPPTDARLGAATNRELTAKADVLLADLDLVMTVANPRDRDFRLDAAAAVEVATFRADGDAGAVRLDAAWAGAPLAIGFQFEPVRDALALFGSATIRWRMGGPTDPTVITCDAQPGVQAVVSPYRLLPDHQRKAA